jgi:hypothetical protein
MTNGISFHILAYVSETEDYWKSMYVRHCV